MSGDETFCDKYLDLGLKRLFEENKFGQGLKHLAERLVCVKDFKYVLSKMIISGV